MSQFDPNFKIGNMDENYLPVVVGAAVVGDWVLRLLFSDGTVGDADFSSERWTGVLEPLKRPSLLCAGRGRSGSRDRGVARWHRPRA